MVEVRLALLEGRALDVLKELRYAITCLFNVSIDYCDGSLNSRND